MTQNHIIKNIHRVVQSRCIAFLVLILTLAAPHLVKASSYYYSNLDLAQDFIQDGSEWYYSFDGTNFDLAEDPPEDPGFLVYCDWWRFETVNYIRYAHDIDLDLWFQDNGLNEDLAEDGFTNSVQAGYYPTDLIGHSWIPCDDPEEQETDFTYYVNLDLGEYFEHDEISDNWYYSFDGVSFYLAEDAPEDAGLVIGGQNWIFTIVVGPNSYAYDPRADIWYQDQGLDEDLAEDYWTNTVQGTAPYRSIDFQGDSWMPCANPEASGDGIYYFVNASLAQDFEHHLGNDEWWNSFDGTNFELEEEAPGDPGLLIAADDWTFYTVDDIHYALNSSNGQWYVDDGYDEDIDGNPWVEGIQSLLLPEELLYHTWSACSDPYTD